jgi:NAD(P) transhydrogenase
MRTQEFDVVVIGSGPAGEKAALTAGFLGKRVALVERNNEHGGAGINTGTLPSKTLRETALALSGLKARNLHGVDLSLRRKATIADFMHHERNVTLGEQRRVTESLQQMEVTCFRGTASFLDPGTVQIIGTGGGQALRLKSDATVIATGSTPFHPPEFDFTDDRVHDSDEILHLKELPRRLAVIGAGVVGSEYASTFAAIGSEVILIDGRESLLPFLDREVARCLQESMHSAGVEFIFGDLVAHCDLSSPKQVLLTLKSGKKLEVDGVLVAAGRSCNTAELNLRAAGITPGRRGILTVDEHYCTEVKHIYAVGDVIGAPGLASTAMEQARIAICHLCGVDFLTKISATLPMGIYTIPEVGMVGETEESLVQKKIEFVAGRAPYINSARGKIIGDRHGFLKLLLRRSNLELLGVHIIGEQATELIHIGLLAMASGEGFRILKESCFSYPSLSELYRYAAIDAWIKQRHDSAA